MASSSSGRARSRAAPGLAWTAGGCGRAALPVRSAPAAPRHAPARRPRGRAPRRHTPSPVRPERQVHDAARRRRQRQRTRRPATAESGVEPGDRHWVEDVGRTLTADRRIRPRDEGRAGRPTEHRERDVFRRASRLQAGEGHRGRAERVGCRAEQPAAIPALLEHPALDQVELAGARAHDQRSRSQGAHPRQQLQPGIARPLALRHVDRRRRRPWRRRRPPGRRCRPARRPSARPRPTAGYRAPCHERHRPRRRRS